MEAGTIFWLGRAVFYPKSGWRGWLKDRAMLPGAGASQVCELHVASLHFWKIVGQEGEPAE